SWGRCVVQVSGALSLASPSDIPMVGFVAENLPVSPAFRAVKAPFADFWAGNKKRPCGCGSHFACKTVNFPKEPYSVCGDCASKNNVKRNAPFFLPSLEILGISAAQNNTATYPRMIMQRAVVVIAQEFVQIDVKEPVARNYPPAQEIGVFRAADIEIRFAVKNAEGVHFPRPCRPRSPSSSNHVMPATGATTAPISTAMDRSH